MLLFSVSPSVSRRTISLPTFVSRRKRGGLLAETRAIPVITISSSIMVTLIPGSLAFSDHCGHHFILSDYHCH